MPYYRLSQMIEYKALDSGVPVVYGNEDLSSIECHICNNWGKRPSQGRFVCPVCGEYNADLNGEINQGKRFSGYILENGGLFDSPPNSGG
jgi:putative transposase